MLVNNAGGDPLREFHTMTIEENLRTLQLNLIAPLALTHAALDGMLRRGRGHIVNISAMAGRVAFPLHRGLRRRQGRPDRLHPGAVAPARARAEPRGRCNHHHAQDHRTA